MRLGYMLEEVPKQVQALLHAFAIVRMHKAACDEIGARNDASFMNHKIDGI